MTTYYDDNFGHYNIEDESDIEFYHEMQAQSVHKICKDCGQEVFIKHDYAICDSCANARERGWQY
jgi:hypothetical protein